MNGVVFIAHRGESTRAYILFGQYVTMIHADERPKVWGKRFASRALAEEWMIREGSILDQQGFVMDEPSVRELGYDTICDLISFDPIHVSLVSWLAYEKWTGDLQ